MRLVKLNIHRDVRWTHCVGIGERVSCEMETKKITVQSVPVWYTITRKPFFSFFLFAVPTIIFICTPPTLVCCKIGSKQGLYGVRLSRCTDNRNNRLETKARRRRGWRGKKKKKKERIKHRTPGINYRNLQYSCTRWVGRQRFSIYCR